MQERSIGEATSLASMDSRASASIQKSVLLAGILACCTSAMGQNINVDIGTSVTTGAGFGPPSSAFDGAAAQAGVWNNLAGTGLTLNALVGLDGTPTAVNLARTSSTNFAFQNANTTGDFELLFDDIHDVGASPAATTYTFSNLAPGVYDVYTYAAAPDSPTLASHVTINGEMQVVVGGIPANSYALGVTHALHTVTTCGSIVIGITSPAASFGSVNGFQLVHVSSDQPLCAGGAANPNPVQVGNSTTLTVTTSPATNPPSTGIAVTGNLTAIGGSASQQFFDDGASGGDVTAGDGIFTFVANVPEGSTVGSVNLPFTATDEQGGIVNGAIALTVTPVVDFAELEPNDSKATATAVNGISHGESIFGISTSSTTTGLDYFKIKTAPAPLGIYRHRLTLTTSGTAGHTGTLRGLTQSGTVGVGGAPNPGTDATIQTTITTASGTLPPRTNQWFGFGKEEEIYYRVTGAAATTQGYFASLTTDVVTAIDVPTTLQAGDITITTMNQGHTTDTDLWVYDGQFNAIATYGNDDNSIVGGGTGVGLQSHLVRNYKPGTYYLALTNFQFATNQPAAFDDDFVTGTLLDFPNAAANSSTTTNSNLTFTISDTAALTSVQVPATKPGAFEVMWFRFVVEGDAVPGDVTGNGIVDVDDLLAVINSWGVCDKGAPCPADIAPDGGNGIVDVDDLLMVINNWSTP